MAVESPLSLLELKVEKGLYRGDRVELFESELDTGTMYMAQRQSLLNCLLDHRLRIAVYADRLCPRRSLSDSFLGRTGNRLN